MSVNSIPMRNAVDVGAAEKCQRWITNHTRGKSGSRARLQRKREIERVKEAPLGLGMVPRDRTPLDAVGYVAGQ